MRILAESQPLVLVMVGLPARGKTYIANRMVRYLRWSGVGARVFNVGNYRRRDLGSRQPASFFDPDNPDGVEARRGVALEALKDLLAWVDGGGQVAIYDATNATRERRRRVAEVLDGAGVPHMFVESVCDDPDIIEGNIVQTKLSMPDYAGIEPEQAVRDFRARIEHYTRAYEPLEAIDGSFVKVVDVGEHVHLHRVRGHLASRLAFFLSNLHLTPRPILLLRHGESQFNEQGRIGGDAPLSDRGQRFARAVCRWLPDHMNTAPVVWTSTLQRTLQTAAGLPWTSRSLRALDEIDAGTCDGWTYAEVQRALPKEFAARDADKLRYRYPRGESYQDVIQRLDLVIVELERQQQPVVIVAHQAVLRCLYGYLVDRPPEDCPHLPVPLHTVIELTPRAYGADERRFAMTESGAFEAVSTPGDKRPG